MHNRRSSPRFERHRKVKIKILSTTEGQAGGRKTFTCSSEDVSIGGIQFSSPRAIEVNVRLEMEVAFQRPPCSFVLTGTVKWMRKEGDKESYRIGVFFIESDHKLLNAWRKLVQSLRNG